MLKTASRSPPLARSRSSRPPPPQAHVTVQPNTARRRRASPGSTSACRTSATTPPPTRSTSSSRRVRRGVLRAGPGLDLKVTKKKLATPIKTDDGEVTEGVEPITWTAKTEADGDPAGGFQDFGLSVQVPGKAGDS